MENTAIKKKLEVQALGIDFDRLVDANKNNVEEVTCCICQMVLVDPQCCEKCESHFCSSCIKSWQKKKNECPFHCKLKLRKPSKVINSILSKLNIKCSYEVNGCNKVLSYDSLQKHEKTCQFITVQCEFCKNVVESKRAHLEKCSEYLKYQLKQLKDEKKNKESLNCQTSRQIKISNVRNSNPQAKINPDSVYSLNLNHSDDENEISNFKLNAVKRMKNDSNVIVSSFDNELSEEDIKHKAMIDDFKTWITKNNATFEKADLIYSNKETIFVAKEQINEGDEILFIPKAILISSDIKNGLSKYANIQFTQLSLPEEICYITLFLLEQKSEGTKSFWKPYLELLPDNYFSIGMFYDDYEIHWLRGSMLFEETRGKREEIKKFYNIINDVVPCDYDEFCWAYSNANSKSIYLKIKNYLSVYLVPMINLLEIDLPGNNQTVLHYDEIRDGFCLRANKKILNNRRIFFSMKDLSNHKLLLNYGVIFDNNPYDEVEINLFFNDFDPFIEQRRAILNNAEEPFVFKLRNNLSLENLGAFLAFLRIVEAGNKQELSKALDYYIHNCISLNNEKKVMKKFEIIFKSRLKNYDTKYEQDDKLIKSDLLTNNQKNCLKIRISEKKIVGRMIEFAEIVQKVLDKQISYNEIKKNIEFRAYLKTLENLNL